MAASAYMTVVRDPLFPIEVAANQRAVFLNNEKPICELGPGKYRRVRDLPAFGIKRLIKFQDYEWTMRVDHVPLSFREPGGPRYFPAAVSAEFTVRTDYRPGLLLQAVSQFDPDSFDAQLRTSAASAVTGHLRTRLGELNHETFASSPDLTQWLNLDAIDIYEGLLRVERFLSVTAHPSEHLIELNQIALDHERDLAEASNQQNILDLEGVRSTQREIADIDLRLTGAAEIAQRTGVPLYVALDPSKAGDDRQAQVGLLHEAIKNPDSLNILSRSDQLGAVLGPVPTMGVTTQEGPVSLQAGQVQLLRLGYNPGLRGLVTEPELQPRLLGSAMQLFKSRDTFASEAVIVTDAPDELRRLLPQLQERLSQLTGAAAGLVRVVPYQPAMPRFIESYYRVVAPPDAHGYRELAVVSVHQEQADTATVRMRFDGASRSVHSIIEGERNRRLEQLQALLMLRQLTIDPA